MTLADTDRSHRIRLAKRMALSMRKGHGRHNEAERIATVPILSHRFGVPTKLLGS